MKRREEKVGRRTPPKTLQEDISSAAAGDGVKSPATKIERNKSHIPYRIVEPPPISHDL